MEGEISKLPKDEADRVMEFPNSYIERGRKEGRKEGIKIGETKSKKRIVLNMLKEGMSHDFIAEVAEIDVEEIEQIKKEAGANRDNKN